MHRRYFSQGLTALLLAGTMTPGLAADLTVAPGQFVMALANRAFLSAGSGSLSAGERDQRLGALLDEDFDIQRISSFVTGRFWQKANEPGRAAFASALRDYLVRTFAQRFADYDGGSFRIAGVPRRNLDHVIVYTEITERTSGRPVKLEWRLVEADGYRVIDVSVEGISMALTQREEFVSVLTRNVGDLGSLVRQLQTNVSAR